MNVIKLNSIGEKKAKKNSIVYFDCLKEGLEGNYNHGDYRFYSNKVVDLETGDVAIGPEAMLEADLAGPCAGAIGLNQRIYAEGMWMDAKKYFKVVEGFNIDTHPKISEKEFYHIPKDEVVVINGEEDIKSLYDKFYKLLSRYGETDFSFPLTVWARSLTLVINGELVTAGNEVQMGDNSNDEYIEKGIVFTNLVLIHSTDKATGAEHYRIERL